MYSYKFKKSGVRTQIICDMNEIVLFVSNKYDCIAFDGGYNYYVEEFLEKCENMKKERYKVYR
ncbi:hypothetical protein RO3G_01739 [Rhizopus delemar RA 99-880]|uniref:Uncharacterized protein n=1 Tax=Rhizopus delemar (strain RA 99-880 / ATCC MYA-4621 / FGSC 9543 / NRRL 43880) TaxID=246409 RepID=I1BLF5_RHIO9|nr:hypothetical protein RO3G_01739 [Rhizopus delemar RA 99-880]|eukprot:EIE77035.1 hypothetical protein RO3G_01739 [Rhizopus delemar RA 99-880]